MAVTAKIKIVAPEGALPKLTDLLVDRLSEAGYELVDQTAFLNCDGEPGKKRVYVTLLQTEDGNGSAN